MIILVGMIKALFQDEEFVSHSGKTLSYKIDCDALTDTDIAALAALISRRFYFKTVVGVPRGGLRLATALQKYVSDDGPTLIVDDVLTTGNSMEEVKRGIADEVIGIVIFARGTCPRWVNSIFEVSEWACL